MGFWDNLKNAANAFGEEMVTTNDAYVAEAIRQYNYKDFSSIRDIAKSNINSSSYKSYQIQAARIILVTQHRWDARDIYNEFGDALITREYSLKSYF